MPIKRKKKVTSKKVGKVSFKKPTVSKQTQDLFMIGAGVILGAIGKRFADNFLAKQDTLKIDPKTLSWIQLAAGTAGAYFGRQYPFVSGLGIGVASESAITILQEMKMITGIGLPPMVPYLPRPNLSGLNKLPQAVGKTNIYGFPQADSVGRSPYTARRAAAAGM